MSLITQYSRISHHTISGSMSATFSVPGTEDFTDGTWTSRDLALSEIGVNEDSKKAYIRINDEVKEIQFAGATGGGGASSLSDTLAVGNTTNVNDIIISTDDLIKGGGSASISLGTTTRPNEVKIYTEDTLNTHSITIIPGSSVQLMMDLSTTNTSSIELNPNTITSTATDIATTITDTISIDPQGLGDGTGIVSTNTTTGNVTQIIYTPDSIGVNLDDIVGGISATKLVDNTQINSSITDGTILSANALFTDGTISSSSNNTSTNSGSVIYQLLDHAKISAGNPSSIMDIISIDPTLVGNGTGIKSEDITTGNISQSTYTPNITTLQSYQIVQVGGIDTVSYTSGTIPPSGIYNNVPIKSTSGGGVDATFYVRYSTGLTTNVIINGTGFVVGDTITLSGADLGGVDGTDDIIITVDIIIPLIISDVISIDPQGLGNGTSIISQNTTIGNNTKTTHKPDYINLFSGDVTSGNRNIIDINSSTNTKFRAWSTSTTDEGAITLTKTNLLASVTDASNTSNMNLTKDTIIFDATDTATTITDTISLDPQGLGNGTGIVSTDATNNYSSSLYVSPTNTTLNVYDTTLTNYNTGIESYYTSFTNTISSKIASTNTAGSSFASILVDVDLTADISSVNIHGDKITMNLPAYADDTAAGTALLSTGTLYQTDGTGASPLNVAGIVMIKQ